METVGKRGFRILFETWFCWNRNWYCHKLHTTTVQGTTVEIKLTFNYFLKDRNCRDLNMCEWNIQNEEITVWKILDDTGLLHHDCTEVCNDARLLHEDACPQCLKTMNAWTALTDFWSTSEHHNLLRFTLPLTAPSAMMMNYYLCWNLRLFMKSETGQPHIQIDNHRQLYPCTHLRSNH